jgi:hypothetical protein
MLLIESGLVLVAIVFAFTFPTARSHWFELSERGFARLARRRGLSVVVVGLAALVLRAALLPILPIPEPVVHDEFGYLLAADTFAHGRLTNPTHPMWAHFETFSILQKPTYQCFAQPAQGLILAAGKVIGGHPFWGVWFSAGLMCSAICWMLQGWLPPRWALLGGLLAVLRLTTFSYWANSYWGGALGAIGGALVLGALPRIKRSQRVRDALVMGLGLAILANSRPYEGFVFSVPFALALLAWMLGKHGPLIQVSLRRVVLPLSLVMALTAAGMGYYFWRVTGNPVRMPYQVERETYAVAPFFRWQSPTLQPIYHHKVMQRMYVDEELAGSALAGSPAGMIAKAVLAWTFYLGPVLTFPLLMMLVVLPYGFSWRQITGRTRFLLLTCAISLVGLGLETLFFTPHYAAPLAGLIFVFLLQAMRRLQLWRWRGERTGLFMTRAVPVICVIMFLLRAAAVPLHLPLTESSAPAWYQRGPKSFGRAAILAELLRIPGRQLVIVRYKPGHEPFEEWVYNDARIDDAKVVWSREMSSAENEELIRHFKDRNAWVVEADEKPPRLLPYQPQ